MKISFSPEAKGPMTSGVAWCGADQSLCSLMLSSVLSLQAVSPGRRRLCWAYWHQPATRGPRSGVNPVGGKGYFKAVAKIAEGQNAGKSHCFEASGDGCLETSVRVFSYL